MNDDLIAHVARLAGYLSGLAAEDGNIRQYTASAFLVSGHDSSDSPEVMIHDHYAAQTDFRFSSSQRLERGLADLDSQLYGCVVRRPLGVPEHTIAHELIADRRRFVVFRIMDMIGDIAPEAYKLAEVHKLESIHPGPVSQVTFFCVRINSGFLVLQFNDDTPFINADSKAENAVPAP
jgi:hypothetical protein